MLNRATALLNFADADAQFQRRNCSISPAEALNFNAVCNLRVDIGAILRELCERKHVNIIEAHSMPDHIHMLVEIPPNQRVSDFMGYLKGKSTMIIFERYSNLKYKYGNRHFWCRGYYVSTVGGNKNGIAKYIREQEHEDMIYDQLTLKEWEDPFKK